MIQNLSIEQAYTYALQKLTVTDTIEKTSFAHSSYLIYQLLMDLYLVKDDKDEGGFYLEVMTKLNDLKKRILPPDAQLFNPQFHDFWKLGCTLKGLSGVRGEEIFSELKKRRNHSLKQQNTLWSYLISEKNIEADKLNNTEASSFNNFIFSLMTECDNMSIELKSNIKESDIEAAIIEFYERQGFIVRDDEPFHIRFLEKGTQKIRKSVTLTVIPPLLFNKNSVAMISVKNYGDD